MQNNEERRLTQIRCNECDSHICSIDLPRYPSPNDKAYAAEKCGAYVKKFRAFGIESMYYYYCNEECCDKWRQSHKHNDY